MKFKLNISGSRAWLKIKTTQTDEDEDIDEQKKSFSANYAFKIDVWD